MCICNLYHCSYFFNEKDVFFFFFFYLCPLWPKLAFDHHGLLIIPIHWLASSLGLLSTSKLLCGGCAGAIWLPSRHPGGCCTLDYQIFSLNNMKKSLQKKKNSFVLSNCLSVLILYFNAAKFSINLFYFMYFTVSFVSQRDEYEIVTETQPFKNS